MVELDIEVKDFKQTQEAIINGELSKLEENCNKIESITDQLMAQDLLREIESISNLLKIKTTQTTSDFQNYATGKLKQMAKSNKKFITNIK